MPTHPQRNLLNQAPSDMHRGLAAYIENQTGYDIDPVSVSLAIRLQAQYRKSDANAERRANRVPLKVQRAHQAAERRRAKRAEKARKLQEQAAALLADADEVAPPAVGKSRPARNAAKRATGVTALTAAEKRAQAKVALHVAPDPEPEVAPEPAVIETMDGFVAPPVGLDEETTPVITFVGEDDPDDDDDF